jgi:hypothetical protein
VSGRINVQQEKNLEIRTQLNEPVECASGGDPLLLYKILPLLYEFFVHYALRVENLSTWSWCGTFEISVSSTERMSHQPIQKSVALFRGHRQTPGIISRNNSVKNFLSALAITIMSWQDVTRFSFDQVSRNVEENVHTTFSLPNPLSESEELQPWGCSKILLSFLIRFDANFWLNQQQQQRLPQFKSMLDGHLSRHLLPAPFFLKIENTT